MDSPRVRGVLGSNPRRATRTRNREGNSMKDYGPMSQIKSVRCPECGKTAEAVSDQRGVRFRVPRHCVGSLGGTLNIMCPGGPVN